MTSTHYTGRFAPSPTGPLHFGSLLAALASYADARSHGGTWLLRIDDIDPPRAMSGASEQIPKTLLDFGFRWDGDIIHQSTQSTRYQTALNTLNTSHDLYLCSCSRRKLVGCEVYPGYCKPVSTTSQSANSATDQVQHKLTASDNENAVRVIMDADVSICDAVQGEQHFAVGKQFGDTVVLRRDDLFSYALCCAVDDGNGISRVVRGSDLLPTTATQVRIMESLNLPAPEYAHIPVAANAAGQKLSKQTQAEPIDNMDTLPTLIRAWECLGQAPVVADKLDSFWRAAIASWQLDAVPKTPSIQVQA